MKSTHTSIAKWMMILAMTVAVGWGSEATGADWMDPSGGVYGNNLNWSPGVPGPGDNAFFSIWSGPPNPTYTVEFDDNESCKYVVVSEQNDVALDLYGYEYTVDVLNVSLGIDDSVQVGMYGSDGALTVIDGLLTASGGLRVGSWDVTVNRWDHSHYSSSLSIAFGGQVSVAWADLHADYENVLNTTEVNSVDGAGSRLDVAGHLNLGTGGVDGMVLTVTNGAAVSVGSARLHGGLWVDGAESTFLASGHVRAGQWGDGLLEVTSGADVVLTGAEISGSVTVDGAGVDSVGSTLRFTDWVEFDGSELEITNGGRLDVDWELDLLNNTIVTIDGTDSAVTCGGSTWIDEVAMVEVVGGGRFTTGVLVVDEDSGVRVGPGGTLDVGGNCNVVWSGLMLESGSACLVGGELKFTFGQFSIEDVSIAPQALELFDSEMIGSGQVAAPFVGDASSVVTASGNLVIGDASRYDGFNHAGRLIVGSHGVTLHSKGFAGLGVLTELDGGVLAAPNGIAIGPGENLVGRGSVIARVAAGFGSVIEATGDMDLGRAADLDGFFSDGVLIVGGNVVTIYDANQAVLGSLTELGDGPADGVLIADNGLVVEFGKNISGQGLVVTPDDPSVPLTNNGVVIGDYPGAIELTGYVNGVGTLTNVTVSGTLSPGLSPVRMHAANLGISSAGKLVMELGGLSGGSQYDQLDVDGDLALDGTLQVLLIDGFAPEIGDSFDILDFASLSGPGFDAVDLPVLAGRRAWDESDLYTTGEISVIGMLHGDTDVDWDVDDDDLNLFEAAFGAAGDWRTDFNEDGRVDLLDFALMRANFGVGAGPAPDAMPAMTPEPFTFGILALGGLAIARRRRFMTM